eukprot:403360071
MYNKHQHSNSQFGVALTIHNVYGDFYTPNPVRIASFILNENDLKYFKDPKLNKIYLKKLQNMQLLGTVSPALPLRDLIIKHSKSSKLSNQKIEKLVRESFKSGLNFTEACYFDYKRMNQIIQDIKNSGNLQQKLVVVVFLLEQIQYPQNQIQSYQHKDNQHQQTRFNQQNCFNDHKILSFAYNDLVDENFKLLNPWEIEAFDQNHQPLSYLDINYKKYQTAHFTVSFKNPIETTIGNMGVYLILQKEANESEDEHILKNHNYHLLVSEDENEQMSKEVEISSFRNRQSNIFRFKNQSTEIKKDIIFSI